MFVYPIDRIWIIHSAFLVSGVAPMLVLSTLCALAAGASRARPAR